LFPEKVNLSIFAAVNSSPLQQVKQLVRHVLVALNLPLTRNLKYDILTKKVFLRELRNSSNCVDVGAHKGEILDLILSLAPKGQHTAFEPIPQMFKKLQATYQNSVKVYPYALSNRTGITHFNVVLDSPAYSGLQQREYKTAHPQIETIEVEVHQLDEVLSTRNFPIDLIKIDVEGGELDVLKGATQILSTDRPTLIFEFGKGASEFYGTMPHHMHDLLTHHGYQIWTIGDFWSNKNSLDSDTLKSVYENQSDYYFVAKYSAN
jgi:FkbM family methyltransferase